MFGIIVRYELSRVFRPGAIFTKLLVGAVFGAVTQVVPKDAGYLVVPMTAPLIVLVAAVIGGRDAMQPNIDGQSAGGYVASRPVSRRAMLWARSVGLAVSGLFFAGLLLLVSLFADRPVLMGQSNLETYSQIHLIEEAGRDIRFRKDHDRECYQTWKNVGVVAKKTCRERWGMASFVVMSPWLLIAMFGWFYLVFSGLYASGQEAKDPHPGSLAGWLVVDRLGRFTLLVLACLLPILGVLTGFPGGPVWFSSATFALHPWFVPMVGGLLVVGMFILAHRRFALGDLRS